MVDNMDHVSHVQCYLESTASTKFRIQNYFIKYVAYEIYMILYDFFICLLKTNSRRNHLPETKKLGFING
jgi:hypothetical protein